MGSSCIAQCPVMTSRGGWGREALEGGDIGIHVNKPLTHAFDRLRHVPGLDLKQKIFFFSENEHYWDKW